MMSNNMTAVDRVTTWPLAADSFARWKPVIAGVVPPDADMQQLVEATRQAIDAGLFYSAEVYSAVVEKLSARLTPEILERNNDRVERGDFGMEVDYARQYLEAIDLRQRRKAAFEQLGARTGMRLGPLILTDYKQMSACVVTSVNGETGLITLAGKRGRHGVRVECSALAILEAASRYRERVDLRSGRRRNSHTSASLFA